MMSRRATMAGLAGASLYGSGAQASGQDLIRFEQMGSAFIEPRTVHVWLPPGYHTSRRRYPVIYMHDGQNVFSPAYAFRGQTWGVDKALSDRAQPDGRGGAIVVGIWNTPKRRSDYAPTGIEALLPVAVRERITHDNSSASAGDNYLRFIVRELKPLIDRSFRTLPARDTTCLMGSSRGGMISLYGLCEYPQIFGAAACLSTHWLLLSAPSATTDPNLETPAITSALKTYLRANLPRAGGHKIWMDHGTINLDRFYSPYQEQVDVAFTSRNWDQGRDFESRVYDGADHNEAAWRARLNDPLDFILANRRA
jgi:enterochelin esterase-like enzyme